ncbi:transmembrane and coiled-coil domain-containing protein 4 isoform X2 [Orussus abietinus]|nr:transmembrane and coiled-coil domain-containing protein 4 isoform X2 [Orussus abietinus]XP_023288543.1 transmembrane and coiled-coil domain-containing protein 4 isoform X2 [Orussus abietinus]XP_023288544.1 transmembrane and coiled-coil domain-containing protein 4 isoform X2 [Orussus abietinus]
MKKLDISNSGHYAYASICCITVGTLFPNVWNEDFNSQYVNNLCQHLNLNDRIKPVMITLATGQSTQSVNPYVTLLLEEPNLAGKTILVIQDMVLLAVNEGEYDARQRVLIREVASILNVPFELVEMYEYSLVKYLSQGVGSQSEKGLKETARRNKISKVKRYAAIGFATVAGGTLIGLTGGLAAPFIGIGVGTILGGASAVALGSTAGAAIVGSIFGVAGAGLTGYKMNKRVGQVEEFGFQSMMPYEVIEHQLHIAIAITGWLNDEDPESITKPWQSLAVSREQYALRYETKYLIELGQALDYILSIAVTVATQEALKYTVLSGLLSAVAWPAALLSIASVIDNPWSVCCRRSSEVGKQLAHVLLTKQHGKRPVTLVGFSLGARVIFYCLREMVEIGGGEGIIQDAVILGAPVTDSKKQWEKCSTIVAGRIVNGYCKADWLLRFLYRTLSMSTGVAGLVPVNCERVTNIDLSTIVSGHREYSDKLPVILRFIGLNTREVEVGEIASIMKKSNSMTPSECTCNPMHEQINISIRPSKSDMCLSSIKHPK